MEWPDTPEAERDFLLSMVKDLQNQLAGARGARYEAAIEILHRVPGGVLQEHTRRQKLARGF